MPPDVTIFAAKYLIFVAAAMAAVIVAYLLYLQGRIASLRWVVAMGITLVLSYVAARLGALLYNDPRPFVVDHVRPLIYHAADNGFPSDHALLAAAIVASVALVRLVWSVPLAIMAFLVDWARVGAGLHHVADAVGSSLCVALAAIIGAVLAPRIAHLLSPYLERTGLLGRAQS